MWNSIDSVPDHCLFIYFECENENWHLLLFQCRYFDESVLKVFVERSGPLPSIYFLSKPLNLIGCHGNQKAQFEKKKKKNQKSTPGR